MALYESIVIIRQDVSSADVDKVVDELKKVITSFNGEVLKTEYWGLRTLAYEIKNNKKGHYYLMGINANNEAIRELNRRIKLSESVIRSSLVRVNEITKDPSPILKDKNKGEEETVVDVTSSAQ